MDFGSANSARSDASGCGNRLLDETAEQLIEQHRAHWPIERIAAEPARYHEEAEQLLCRIAPDEGATMTWLDEAWAKLLFASFGDAAGGCTILNFPSTGKD